MTTYSKRKLLSNWWAPSLPGRGNSFFTGIFCLQICHAPCDICKESIRLQLTVQMAFSTNLASFWASWFIEERVGSRTLRRKRDTSYILWFPETKEPEEFEFLHESQTEKQTRIKLRVSKGNDLSLRYRCLTVLQTYTSLWRRDWSQNNSEPVVGKTSLDSNAYLSVLILDLNLKVTLVCQRWAWEEVHLFVSLPNMATLKKSFSMFSHCLSL